MLTILIHRVKMAGLWLLLPILVAQAYDKGPTYGRDYAGRDYNVTYWNSSSSQSKNHYQQPALLCQRYCELDANCCAWTYCPPDDPDRERCCLKNSVPDEVNSTHWTGLPSRALNPDNPNKLSDYCSLPRPKPAPPYPAPAFHRPQIHNVPDCLIDDGWHDIAGALSLPADTGQRHHVFQGCPLQLGWHHAYSDDLVHWTNLGISVLERNESYAGFHSLSSPCSGFATVDDDGNPCVGFRQCSSDRGVAGGQAWDAPLELRCATNASMQAFGPNQYLYNVSFYRALPYDPVRPWKDTDGQWYSTISTDGCNATTRAVSRWLLLARPASFVLACSCRVLWVGDWICIPAPTSWGPGTT